MSATEQWRPVAGFPFYSVSDRGRVLSWHPRYRKPRLLRPMTNPDGYKQVTLCAGDLRWKCTIHRLVADAFCGPRPAGHVVRHLDGDPANNTAANLAFGTASENVRDTIRHGRNPKLSQTHCHRGHPFDEQNTYVWTVGQARHRSCRTCNAATKRRSQDRRRDAAARTEATR